MWSANCHFLPERHVCSLSKQVCAGGEAASHIPVPGVMTLQYADPLHSTAQRAGLAQYLPVLTSTYLREKASLQRLCFYISWLFKLCLHKERAALFNSVMCQQCPDFQLIYELYNHHIFIWKTSDSQITFEEKVQSDRKHKVFSQFVVNSFSITLMLLHTNSIWWHLEWEAVHVMTDSGKDRLSSIAPQCSKIETETAKGCTCVGTIAWFIVDFWDQFWYLGV